jgi:hypothetical protein
VTWKVAEGAQLDKGRLQLKWRGKEEGRWGMVEGDWIRRRE